jgi:hypothetical protein
MIDDGELDWKLIAISSADPHAAEINDVSDIEKFYPGTVTGIREWFRWYKTPDGKPINGFGHGEKALSAKEAIHVRAYAHRRLLSVPFELYHRRDQPRLSRTSTLLPDFPPSFHCPNIRSSGRPTNFSRTLRFPRLPEIGD